MQSSLAREDRIGGIYIGFNSQKINITPMKLIALTPLSNCHPNIHKIIKLNTTYFFYNGYSIDADGIIHQSHKVPDNFFKSADTNEEPSEKNDIRINISAVVGKNGSGKSTIIELLFRAINNIAY